MNDIDQVEDIVINETIEEVKIQDEAACFLRLSLYEGECLSML